MTALAILETRRDLFRQHVLRSGQFALRYSRERRHDNEALDRQRDNLLQAMDACHRYADAWQIVVGIALNLQDHMERQGHWEIWEWHLGEGSGGQPQPGGCAGERHAVEPPGPDSPR